MSGSDYLINLDGVWHYRRRVPTDLRSLDGREFVKRSTKQRDRLEAAAVARRINQETEIYWQSLVSGTAPTTSSERYEKAVQTARTLGVDYVPNRDLLSGPIDRLLSRIERLSDGRLLSSSTAAEALLGTADTPEMNLSDLATIYFDVTAERFLEMSEDQVKKFTTPRVRAVKRLVQLIGDKPLSDVSRNDAIRFREWWLERVREKNLHIRTANKDIGQVNTMINAVADRYRLALKEPFAGMRLRGAADNQRPSFDDGWIRERLLAPGALAGLNVEARTVVLVMINTGLRPSEIVNLEPSRIVLDVEVPHVQIRPDGRQIKTDPSKRDMPLLGVSLEAMMAMRDGFSHYRGKGDSLSAAVNKFFDENGLKQSAAHTLYSLRHSFQDRLIAVEAPERVQAELMGHKLSRPRYGHGASLAQKAQWLERISF